MKDFTSKTGIPIIKCSAKSSTNVEKGFVQLTSKLIEKWIAMGDNGDWAFN